MRHHVVLWCHQCSRCHLPRSNQKVEVKMANHRKLIDQLTSLLSTLKETEEHVDTQRNEDPEKEIKNLYPSIRGRA